MQRTGFDFEYCCILPPYNSIQAQVAKIGVGQQKPRLLDQGDQADPTVLLDPDTGRRLRLKYALDDNSFSEGGKLVYWKAPFDLRRNGSTTDAYFSHLYIYPPVYL
jgi:hypothetical protein